MKKLLALILAVTMVLLFSAPALAADLIIDGGGVPPGEVGPENVEGSFTVTNDEVNLYATFTMTGSWEMTETHLYVANDPPAKHSPGKFPYKQEHDPAVTTYMYTIPLSDLELEEEDYTVCIAAHAALTQTVLVANPLYDPENPDLYPEYIEEVLEESAWGQDEDPEDNIEIRPGKEWATYFEYELVEP